MGFGKEGQLRYLVSSCHEGDASLQIPGEAVSCQHSFWKVMITLAWGWVGVRTRR